MQEKTKPKIEILVVEHKPSYVPNNALLKPIHVGTAIAGKKLDGTVYADNTGDNISDRNRSYCEMTAVYWAWKNLDADYYGLFHYRRYLSFSPKQDVSPYAGVAYPSVTAAMPDMDLNEESMRALIETNDVLVPRLDDTRVTTNDESVYVQYEREHYIKDLDYCIDYIKKNYPDIAEYMDVLQDSKAYFCNMFVMRRDIFNDYCTFMFDVLENFEKDNDISGYDVNQYRVTGFLAERLTNVYIYFLRAQEDVRLKELQLMYFQDTNPQPLLLPAAKENNVPIVLAANNYYIPYISTLIHSIAAHASADHTYDITVFHHDISAESMTLLTAEFVGMPNIKIRFYDISPRYDEYKGLFTRGHFALETYFRLFIQDIMVEYDKVLYLDGDMIVNADVAELYATDLGNNLLGAALDPDTAGLYNGFEPKKKEYMDTVLKIKRPYEYFQAGVILFNLDQMRKSLNVKELIAYASSYNWELLDQDVLNNIAQGRVKFVDMAWNVMYDWRRIRLTQIVSLAPIELYLKYVAARKNPKIIHYAGPEKPWHDPDCDYATYFWHIARGSIFYEQIITRMTDWRAGNHHIQKLPLRPRVVRTLRRTADKVAPHGTARRKPITMTSRGIKKVMRKMRI